MSDLARPGPQQTWLFRVVSFAARLQLGYLLRSGRRTQILVLAFVSVAGFTALAIISLAAYLTALPLLFPPLGPSAFILFHTPMAAPASPKHVILAHATALASGLLALRLAHLLFPGAGLLEPSLVSWPRILAIAGAMALCSAAMIGGRFHHPPAAATALIAAMGFLESWVQVVGLLVAVLLLVAEAFVLNRVVGGLPYPLWRSDPAVARRYGALAGLPEEGGYWRAMASRLLEPRD